MLNVFIGQRRQLTGQKCIVNMRNATCVRTHTSEIPTRVAFLFISILWMKVKVDNTYNDTVV